MRTDQYKPGKVRGLRGEWEEILDGSSTDLPIQAIMHTDKGALNKIVHIWAYESLVERSDILAGAAAAISPDMQDQLALMGSGGECREELERIRAAGLQQPVIAPFAVGDHVPSYRRAIEACAE